MSFIYMHANYLKECYLNSFLNPVNTSSQVPEEKHEAWAYVGKSVTYKFIS